MNVGDVPIEVDLMVLNVHLVKVFAKRLDDLLHWHVDLVYQEEKYIVDNRVRGTRLLTRI